MTKKYDWTQPICGPCYEKRNPGRRPLKIKPAPAEMCVDCGGPTTEGIYVRVDPKEAAFPTLEDSDAHN